MKTDLGFNRVAVFGQIEGFGFDLGGIAELETAEGKVAGVAGHVA